MDGVKRYTDSIDAALYRVENNGYTMLGLITVVVSEQCFPYPTPKCFGLLEPAGCQLKVVHCTTLARL